MFPANIIPPLSFGNVKNVATRPHFPCGNESLKTQRDSGWPGGQIELNGLTRPFKTTRRRYFSYHSTVAENEAQKSSALVSEAYGLGFSQGKRDPTTIALIYLNIMISYIYIYIISTFFSLNMPFFGVSQQTSSRLSLRQLDAHPPLTWTWLTSMET